MATRDILYAAAGGSAAPTYIEDVFSTYLYTGNGSSQTITNGIDLSTKGGLVWCKSRTNGSGSFNHQLIDTVRGRFSGLQSNTTDSENGDGLGGGNFSTTGFSVVQSGTGNLNNSSNTYCSWTFREQPKFFDIVTYTGNGSGSGRTISHNLGSVPGMMILKVTNLAGDDWYVYHRSIPTRLLALNSINSTDPTPPQFVFGNGTTAVAPTSTEFTIGSTVNGNTYNYIVYLFAHDAGGFGLTGTDNVISCGSFTTDGSGFATVSLGYEPQYLMFKRSSGTGNWVIVDTMRGWSMSTDAMLRADLSNAESNTELGNPTATGFYVEAAASSTYIYMAIRRGPMAVPTLGTSVFNTNLETTTANPQTLTTGFPVDLTINTLKSSAQPRYVADRLRGGSTTSSILLSTDSTAAEISYSGFGFGFDNNTGIVDGNFWNNTSAVLWNFRRAPGFFDIVCYTGTGSGTSPTHNLGVIPELKIIKSRSSIFDWTVGGSIISGVGGRANYAVLNTTDAVTVNSTYWAVADTSTTFSVRAGNAGSDGSGVTYVAYLFASVAGVSKVGSYTGDGTDGRVINCGFTTGARFVLIKSTSNTGNWRVWDSARGIVAGNDPFLTLNTQAAEVTNSDDVDATSSGFIVNYNGLSAVNEPGWTYIYLAIA